MTLARLGSGGYRITKKGAITLTFSGDARIAPPGRILEIAEPHGERIAFHYGSGALTAVETALAGAVSIERNSQGLVSRMNRERDGTSTAYEYSPDGYLVLSRDSVGRVTRYAYGADGKLASITDPLARIMTFSYDSAGRMEHQTEFGGAYRGFAYDVRSDGSRIVSVRETDGQTSRYFFDATLKLLKKIAPDGGVEEFTSNADFQLLSKKDPTGAITRYAYDAHGNLASVRAPLDPAPIRIGYDPRFDVPNSFTPLAGAPIEFTVDPGNGDRTRIVRKAGARTLSLVLGYDPFGNALSKTNPFATYSDAHDANGLPTTVFDARNPETRSYDLRFRLAKRSFANGRVLEYGYDDLDRVIEVTDSQGPERAFVYDEADRIVEKRVSAEGKSQITRYGWDDRDRLVAMTNAKGEVTRWVYDEFRALDGRGAVLPNPTSMIDAKGRVTRYEYDLMDRLAVTTDPTGAATVQRYDLRGDLREVEDDAHRITRFSFDANRRLVRRDRPVALGQGPGNVSARETTLYTYDLAGKLTREETYSEQAPNGERQITEIAYDAFERRIGKKLSRKKGEGAAVVDEIASYRYADLLETEAMIGADNEVAKLAFGFEAVPPFKATSYSVAPGPRGAMFGVTAGTFALGYDPSGEIAEVRRGSAVLYAKTYDPAGRLTRVTAGGGAGWSAWSSEENYDGFGRLVLRKDSGDLSETLAYDETDRIVELVWKEKARTALSESIEYDAVGNVVRSIREDIASTYEYDERDTLTGISSKRTGRGGSSVIGFLLSLGQLPKALNQDFAYDSVGNRTRSGASSAAVYLENQLVSEGTRRFVSDGDGLGRIALETDLKTNLQKRYAYRADGRLVSFEKTFDEDPDTDDDPKDPVLTRAVYGYDALGRRLGKRIERKCRRFKRTFTNGFTYLGSEDRILLGKDGGGNEFLYVDGSGIDEHLARLSKKGAKSLRTDHLGSVLNAQAVGGSSEFGPFGEMLGPRLPISARSDPANYGFTGRSLDAESGLYYYRARTYSPGTGRFMQKDPIGFNSGEFNMYRYGKNNPIKYVDPQGTDATLFIAPPDHEVLGITDPKSKTGMTYVDFGPASSWSIGIGVPTKGVVNFYSDYPTLLIPLVTYPSGPISDQNILSAAKDYQALADGSSYLYTVLPGLSNPLGPNATNCYGFVKDVCGNVCK